MLFHEHCYGVQCEEAGLGPGPVVLVDPGYADGEPGCLVDVLEEPGETAGE